MSNAEKFIQENTRYTYNYNSYAQDPEPWLTPDDARKAVEIAKEEVIENMSSWLYEWGYLDEDDICELRKHLEE